MPEKGSLVGSGLDFIDSEAICSDEDSDKENVSDIGSQDADFVDNVCVNEGNHLALFQTQERQAEKQKVKKLKRRLQLSPPTPQGAQLPLSPVITVQPCKKVGPAAKRRLFTAPRGCLSARSENEAQVTAAECQVQTGTSDGGSVTGSEQSYGESGECSMQFTQSVLRAKSQTAVKLAVFKFCYAFSYCEITRIFKHDKTLNQNWVAALFAVEQDAFTAACKLLTKHCSCIVGMIRDHEKGPVGLCLFEFQTAKSRDTVQNLLQTVLNVSPQQCMLQPPKIRGQSPALFWYKATWNPQTFVHGELPEWITTQVMLTDRGAEQERFDLSQMIQWAYDNAVFEESAIAYEYALLAPVSSNARAFLACPNQARIVRDCATMANHYSKAEMARMSMSAYIDRMCNLNKQSGSWVNIMGFLKFQHIDPLDFINAMRLWLRGVPKRNALCFIGPSNTGKSMFTNTLLSLLRGRVLNYLNHGSHFWLTPLTETRVALIDDVTAPCLQYIDTHLRNCLDGYVVHLDRKFKSSLQVKCPPLLLTTNIDFPSIDKYCYLNSRIRCFYFNEQCPVDDNGEAVLKLTAGDWKHFFQKLWSRLDLTDQDTDDDGSSGTFVCTARSSNAAD